MDDNWNKEVISSFIRIGIIVLTVIGVFALGVNYMPNAVSVTNSSTKKLPIYCVDTDKRQVAISFDVTGGNEQTKDILDCLAHYNVNASFFLSGDWIDQYGDDVKSIVAAGHDVGNHGQNHKQMSGLGKSACMTQIKEVHDKVKSLTGQDMILFRPPYGDYDNELITACNELHYYCIRWNIDSMDWKDYDAKSIVNCILKDRQLSNGSIILMHNGGKHTLEALPKLIERLKAKGFEIVPVSQLIHKENYEMDPMGRQYQK